MDLWMVAGLGLGVFGAALATLIAQGISAVFSFLLFLSRMRRYKVTLAGLTGRNYIPCFKLLYLRFFSSLRCPSV